jgi:tRNA A37 methylthiotransferase MiaB
MPGQIDRDTALDRMARLKAAASASLQREAERWEGREVEVLFEGEKRGRSQGYTREYLEFRPGAGTFYNELRRITVKSIKNGILTDE